VLRLFHLLILLLLTCSMGTVSAKEIKICTDKNHWCPFTYADGKKAAGTHIEIVEKALTSLGHKVVFTPLPWLRCLKKAAHGQFHAVVSASYKPDRAELFNYPRDAATVVRSEFLISQAEYVVVSDASSSYKFKGDLATIPTPVRSVLGYSIIDYLDDKNIKVTSGRNTPSNVRELVRRKVGVVVMTSQTARFLNSSGEFSGLLTVHPTPIRSKSYFIIFPKLSNHLEKVEQENILLRR